MTAQRIDGKQISNQIQQEVAAQVAELTQQRGIVPCLAAVLVGENPASEVYVRNKQRGCERVGMTSRLERLPASASETELLDLVARLNADPAVHGILVQLPLPKQIRETEVLDAVHPLKDVDCFHPDNVGRLSQGRPRFLPCTPHGVQQLLHRSQIPVAGQEVVIVGRSDIVGKPLAMLLSAKDSSCGASAANATVTLAHSRTRDLAEVTRRADILIAAIGQPKFITADMIKPGAAVIDVGINRTPEGLCGDVDFEPALAVAGQITPVPGGVGPLTIAMLLLNTLSAARWQTA
ncbi:MAG TPA: bifunctional methylenetetrahydrofolate dehydrogenase/methenyltetrahydrofolate cyclohydrolase FolD [Pirellulaceae bacterium]|nr:bifunctional methylenetetrahydrofolate dehydrogenase/methenyltetrahydrofolate cyclohydrolase FolD [Pirellulaceae bacterium]